MHVFDLKCNSKKYLQDKKCFTLAFIESWPKSKLEFGLGLGLNEFKKCVRARKPTNLQQFVPKDLENILSDVCSKSFSCHSLDQCILNSFYKCSIKFSGKCWTDQSLWIQYIWWYQQHTMHVLHGTFFFESAKNFTLDYIS